MMPTPAACRRAKALSRLKLKAAVWKTNPQA
jgi:hypothetical protein